MNYFLCIVKMKSIMKTTFIFSFGKLILKNFKWTLPIILIVLALPACKKDTGLTFTVNETIATQLTNEGIPPDIARFFAATRVESSSPDDTTLTCLQTFPNGATREIIMHIRPNRIYTPTAEEVANTTPGTTPIYDIKYSSSIQGDGSVKMNLTYFIPKSALPGAGTKSSAFSKGGEEGAGISWQEIGNKGSDVTIGSLIDYANESGIETGPLGPIYNLASALSDVTSALDLSGQTKLWLAELDALENCAANPTNPVAQSDPNYSAAAVAKVQSARSDLKLVTGSRFLNIMTEKAMDLNPVTAVQAVGLKQGYIWNEQTLKDVSENTIMREVRLFVVSCENIEPFEGKIDVLHDCTTSGSIDVTRTQWHIQTRIKWVYDATKAMYVSQGTYSFNYTQTITGGGSSCAINKSSSGELGTSGALVVIDDPTVQNYLGYGYLADGNLDAIVDVSSDCQGYTITSENWTVTWLPQIKGFRDGAGGYSGEKTDSCGSGTGYEKITWSFSVPSGK
jgi:hypothetical protein